MVSYHSQLITPHNRISDVFKPPESCRSGRGQTDSQFSILNLLAPFWLYEIWYELRRLYGTFYFDSFLKDAESEAKHNLDVEMYGLMWLRQTE